LFAPIYIYIYIIYIDALTSHTTSISDGDGNCINSFKYYQQHDDNDDDTLNNEDNSSSNNNSNNNDDELNIKEMKLVIVDSIELLINGDRDNDSNDVIDRGDNDSNDVIDRGDKILSSVSGCPIRLMTVILL
jgi:hypothetical protein